MMLMSKLFKLHYKETLNKGFTTFEVLISIIVALAFVSVAMQSLVLAMGMKVQAMEKQRANQLIQEDLELLNVLSSNVPEDHDNMCNPIGASPAIQYTNGYAQVLWNTIPGGQIGTTAQLNQSADGTISGKRLRLNRTHVSGTSSIAPHKTLKIHYQVQELNNANVLVGNVVAERYVEVIPDVALQCP